MPHIFPALLSSPLALRDAIAGIDRASSSAARVEAAADALVSYGFERVGISLRDGSLNVIQAISRGLDGDSSVGGAFGPLPGAVWRRRLPHLERFRVGDVYVLSSADPWVSREFFGTEAVAPWEQVDVVVAVLRGADGEPIGMAMLSGMRDGAFDAPRRFEVEALLRHLSARLAFDAAREIARRRALRLQRLQEAGAALARSLDEHEILRELGRQAMRATGADGVTITQPNLDTETLVTAYGFARGGERVGGSMPLGDGLISEVAHTGRPVRIGDREADRARERAGIAVPLSLYDAIGEGNTAASVLAVPMLVGIHLVGVLAVHAVANDVFGPEDEETLATMSSQAATAIANARRYAESERERRQTEALADIARAVGESLRLGEVLRLILRHAVALLGAEGACVSLRNDDYLHIVAAVGAADVLAGVHVPVATSLNGRAVTTNNIVISNDLAIDETSSKQIRHLAQVERAVVAPLVTAQGTIGAISVVNRATPFNDDDGRVLHRLADQVAVAIVNARLFEEIERATKEWKLAFDSIASGIVVLEENLQIRRCNLRAAALCQRTIPEMLRARFRDAIRDFSPGFDGEAIEALLQQTMNDGQPVRDTIRDASGTRLLQLFAAPHPDGGCVVTFDDVTNASRVVDWQRGVLEAVSDTITLVGIDGYVSYVNPAGVRLFGYDVTGVHVATLTAPESLAEVLERERAARAGVPQQYECVVMRADGAKRRVQVTTAAQTVNGSVTGNVACLRELRPD